MGVGNEATQVGGSGLRAAHFARIGENALGPTQGPDGNSVTVTVTVTNQVSPGSLSIRKTDAKLKELFPDWTDADLVLAIEEADGDLERTVERISEGERLPAHCLHVC